MSYKDVCLSAHDCVVAGREAVKPDRDTTATKHRIRCSCFLFNIILIYTKTKQVLIL